MKFALSLIAILPFAYAAAPTDKTVSVAGTSAVLSTGSAPGVSRSAVNCQSGSYLTYSIKTETIPGATIDNARNKLGDWIHSAPGQFINGNGNNGVGSTRNWSNSDTNLGESQANFDTLTAITGPSSGNSNLEQQWSSGQQGFSSGLTIYESHHDLTVQNPSGTAVTLQYYINACASDQDKAYNAIGYILTDAVNFWAGEIKS